jgi:hypothetical protein
MVYVDKQPIGKSPISTSFIYYGTREVEVVADGYRTEKILRKIKPPWYQIPPLDFVSETLWPWELRDERVLDIAMVPSQVPASEELQGRAEGMRLQASQEMATSLPVVDQAPIESLPPAGPNPVLPQPAVPAAPRAPAVLPPSQVLPPAQPLGGWLPQRIPEVGGSYRVDIEGNDNSNRDTP